MASKGNARAAEKVMARAYVKLLADSTRPILRRSGRKSREPRFDERVIAAILNHIRNLAILEQACKTFTVNALRLLSSDLGFASTRIYSEGTAYPRIPLT